MAPSAGTPPACEKQFMHEATSRVQALVYSDALST